MKPKAFGFSWDQVLELLELNFITKQYYTKLLTVTVRTSISSKSAQLHYFIQEKEWGKKRYQEILQYTVAFIPTALGQIKDSEILKPELAP